MQCLFYVTLCVLTRQKHKKMSKQKLTVSECGRWTFGVADDGLSDVVLLQRHFSQSDPLLTVWGVQVGGDQTELQRFVHVFIILVDHSQRGERLISQRSCRRRERRYIYCRCLVWTCITYYWLNSSKTHRGCCIPCLMISIHIKMASSFSPLA